MQDVTTIIKSHYHDTRGFFNSVYCFTFYWVAWIFSSTRTRTKWNNGGGSLIQTIYSPRRSLCHRQIIIHEVSVIDLNRTNSSMASRGHPRGKHPLLYKLRSVQNTGTCYPGQGWFVRNLGVPDKSSRGLGSMSRYSAQILICFIAYIFLFFHSSVGLGGNFAGLPVCTVPSVIVHCNQNEAGHQTIKAPSMPCWNAAGPSKQYLAFKSQAGENDR